MGPGGAPCHKLRILGKINEGKPRTRERGSGRAPTRSPPWRRRPRGFSPHGPGGRSAAVGAKRPPGAATAGLGAGGGCYGGCPQPLGEGKGEEGARANPSHRPEKGEAVQQPSAWQLLRAEAAGSPPLSPGSLPHSLGPPPPPPVAMGTVCAAPAPGRRRREENGGQGGRGGVWPARGKPEGRPWRLGGRGEPARPPA